MPLRPFVLAAALAALAAPASARVGVTSVTAGDPLGKPPAADERVLRVGVDVQPNERITTGASDRAHVVFLDGTSLTVGPNAVMVVDRFVYDPDKRTGELAVNATRGVFRFVGGAISKNSEIVVRTPSASIGVRGGIAVVSVAEGGATKAQFLFGESLRMTGQGVTQTATRNGSEMNTGPGRPPSPPVPIAVGGLNAVAPGLEAAPRSGAPTATPAPAAAPPGQIARSAAVPLVQPPPQITVEAALAGSQLGAMNSGLAPRQLPPVPKPTPGTRGDGQAAGGPGPGGPPGAGPGPGGPPGVRGGPPQRPPRIATVRLADKANKAGNRQVVNNNNAGKRRD